MTIFLRRVIMQIALTYAGIDEVRRIERPKLRRYKQTILTYENIVKVDFASTLFFSLHHNHIPVNDASIAVIGIVVRLPGSEVK
jgi:hypothetical protein